MMATLLFITGCNQSVIQNQHYTVKFNPGMGKGDMPPVSGPANTSIRLPACTFTNENALFYGWATSASGGKVFSDEATITLVQPEMTLYALWMERGVEYITVTFHAQNGTDRTTQQKIPKGQSASLFKSEFQYINHLFRGWSLSPDSNDVAYTDGQNVSLTSDLNLYAVWEKEEVSPPTGQGVLTFHSNGGTGTMEPISGLEEGVSVPLPKNQFVKEDCVFIGWAYSRDAKEPAVQDQSTFYTFNTGTSNLYAVWAKKEEVVQISFDANGGTGTKDPIYVRRGENFQMPDNTFTPPADKLYYTCTSYDDNNTTNAMSKYKVNGYYSFLQDTTLYAYWTRPRDPSLGGNSEKYKGQTVFVEGFNVKDEDWVQVSTRPEKYFAEWKPGCGWYDVDQSWLNFCWAASASNAIHWWLDRNADYVDRYFKESNKEKPSFAYSGKGQSDVFKIFTTNWTENKGGYTNIGFNWFINMDEGNSIQPSAKGKGGYFKDVFGDQKPLSTTLDILNRRSFNEFIVDALDKNQLVTFGERNMGGGHAITCWGFEFDDEGYISAVYYTDSATPWNSWGKQDLSLGKIAIKYDNKWIPYMQTEMLWNGEIFHGRVDITFLWAFDQGKDQWEAYFSK